MVRINFAPEKKNKEHNAAQGNYFVYEHRNYSNPEAVENLLIYMFNPEKMKHDRFAVYGVPHTKNIPLLAAAFKYVRTAYGQDNRRRLNHFQINLSEEETEEFGLEGLELIMKEYSLVIAKEYQAVWVIHENKPKTLHGHLLFSHISYRTGRRHHRGNKFIGQEMDRINVVLESVRKKLAKKIIE